MPHSEAVYQRKELHAEVEPPCVDIDTLDLTDAVKNIFSSKTSLDGECRWLLCPYYDRCDLKGWGSYSNERQYAFELIEKILDADDQGVAFADSIKDQLLAREHFTPTKRQISALEGIVEEL